MEQKVKVDRDLFECPVCCEIPAGLIYQCKNSHSICDSCSSRIKFCPQCAEPLGSAKLRNRILEAFVEGMEVDCKFKEKGCKVRVPRKDLTAHVERSCEFRSAFNLCKILGLTNCNFVAHPGPGQGIAIYNHLVEQHPPQTKASVELRNSRWVFKATLSRSLEYMRTSKENRINFCPLEVVINSSPVKLLLSFNINILRGDYSVICLYLGKAPPVPAVEVTIEIRAPKKDFRLTWTGKPAPYTKVESLLSNPPFTIRIPWLLEVLGGDGGADSVWEELKAEVTIS